MNNGLENIEPIDLYARIAPLISKDIDDKISAYANKSMYNLVDIPAHTHNGIDSGRINTKDLIGSTGTTIILGSAASDTLQYSLDTERVVNGNSSGAPKSVKIFKSGSIRLKFEHHCQTNFTGNYGYIRKNGVNLQQVYLNQTSYTQVSLDINIAFGDIIDFYVNYYGTSNANTYIRNFRIYYDDVILTEIPNSTVADTNL